MTEREKIESAKIEPYRKAGILFVQDIEHSLIEKMNGNTHIHFVKHISSHIAGFNKGMPLGCTDYELDYSFDFQTNSETGLMKIVANFYLRGVKCRNEPSHSITFWSKI